MSRHLRHFLVAAFTAGSLLSGAVVVSPAGAAVTRPVVSINGQHYSRTDLERELKTLTGNADFVGTLQAPPKTGAKYDAAFVAQVLTNHVYTSVIHAVFQKHKLKVQSPPPASIVTATAQSFGGDVTFRKFPKDYQDRAILRQAEVKALQDEALSKIDTQKYYNEHKPEYLEACVAHLLVATKAEADKARARVVAGETFAKVAGEVSTDPGSKVKGGDLGCTSVSSYVKEFAEAARTLKIGELSQPVKSQFGFHLLKVAKRTDATYESVKPQLEQQLGEPAQRALSEVLTAQLKGAKVSVDPAFGTYVADGGRGLPEVKEPGFKASANPSTAAPAPAH